MASRRGAALAAAVFLFVGCICLANAQSVSATVKVFAGSSGVSSKSSSSGNGARGFSSLLFCCTHTASSHPETPLLMPLLAGLGPALVEQLGSKVSASLSGLKERLEAVGGTKGRVVASLLSPLQGTASESTTCRSCCCCS